MLKRLLVVTVFLTLIASEAFALSDNFVSGDTVSFSSVARLVRFSSPTNFIRIENLSHKKDVYIDLECRATDNSITASAVITPSSVLRIYKVGYVTPNVVQINYSTRQIGFIGEGSIGTFNYDDRVMYTVTGDHGDF